jgi:hypothetical protein
LDGSLAPRPGGPNPLSVILHQYLSAMTATTYDPDRWLAQLMECRHLSEAEMKLLCARVREILVEESNIQPVSAPVTICGDIHGQFWDLLELLRVGGQVPDTSYVFMGDFVDRGHHSLETLSLLLVLKARCVSFISASLIRTENSVAGIRIRSLFYAETMSHGRLPRCMASTVRLLSPTLSLLSSSPQSDECQQKYGSSAVWKACCTVFDHLNLAAVRPAHFLRPRAPDMTLTLFVDNRRPRSLRSRRTQSRHSYPRPDTRAFPSSGDST